MSAPREDPICLCYDFCVSKFVRLTLYVLLCALFLSLGDGPFLDEILVEETQQQQFIADGSNDLSTNAPASCMSVYHTMLNFLRGEDRPSFAAAPAHRSQISFARRAFASLVVAPLDKPPRSLA